MRISVVIPAHDSARTLAGTLASVAAQTLPALEIIVVDDASTDNSAALAEAFGQERGLPLTVLCLAENKGPSRARNRGWDAAKGDWIAFLDADDQWHQQKLEIAAKVLAERGDIDILGHGFSAEPLAKERFTDADIEAMAVIPVPFLSVLVRNTLSSSCVVIRRGVAERFEETMRRNEDHELYARIAMNHAAARLDAVLTRLDRPILAPGGLSSNRLKMRLGEMRTYCRLAWRRKLLLPFLPLLLLFSALKHLRKSLG